MLLQLASELKEELVARRGRLWTWQEFTCLEEVREAMRLDIPSPLGARIFLMVVHPDFTASPSSFNSISISSAAFCCWRIGVQEAGRPLVEN